MRRPLFILLIILGVSGGAFLFWSRHSSGNAAPSLETAAVTRGELLATVVATGTIEPEEVVDIGAQVVGKIQEFGRDPRDGSKTVDYGSQVEDGTVLAKIDDALYRARLHKAASMVEQAKAQIVQASADVQRAEADLLQMKAKHDQTAHDWERAQQLKSTKVISDAEFDTFRSAYDVAKANLRVAEVAIDQGKAAKLRAETTVPAAQADQEEAQQNLDYTTIRSPVRGVIVDRRVNVGQTVVSSLNAPSLFLIAKDLKRLQVWASVNEADIGRIKSGQRVELTVDAFPGEVFKGEVSQVRLNATMTQNVVTYTVVVTIDNSSGRLLPYLTGNLKFEVARQSNVLLIPNAALRWRPQPQQVVADARDEYIRDKWQATQATGAARKVADQTPHDRGVVWVVENSFVRPIAVQFGVTDGVLTEIVSGDLRENQTIVVGETLPTEVAGTTSPFSPQMYGGGKK